MREPRPDGASRDPYLGPRATRPDYKAYTDWCQARGIPSLQAEPLAYGDVFEKGQLSWKTNND